MKGVILSINKEVEIVDITHRVGNYNLVEGAFLISQVCPFFPEGTIHLAVIDPGVGTSRKGLIIQTDNYYFVGPDNGIFSFVLKKEAVRKIVEINRSKFKIIAPTFEGRDVFAPVAGYISLERQIEDFGLEIRQIKQLRIEKNSILHIDEFGNIITSVQREFNYGENLAVVYRGKKVKAKFVRCFSEVKEGNYLVLKGSSGYLEVDRNRSSAAKALDARVGEKIEIFKVDEGQEAKG